MITDVTNIKNIHVYNGSRLLRTFIDGPVESVITELDCIYLGILK